MNPEQFAKLLSLLEKLVSHQYTITGAADWPILASIGGVFIAVLGFMWRDVRASIDKIGTAIKESRNESKSEVELIKAEIRVDIDRVKADNEKAHDLLWAAHRDCQHECCPRKKE